jgi:hypothetical protein
MTTKRSFAGPTRLTVTALVLVVAGCGGQPFPRAETRVSGVPTTVAQPANPQARLLAAVQRATSARTARFTMNMSASGFSDDDGNGTISGGGVIDMVRERLQMTLHVSDATDDESVEMRVIDGTLYAKEGTTWESGSLAGSEMQTPNPGGYLDYLRGIAPDVRIEGHDILRGDETTRYGATVDLAQALKRAATALGQAQLRHVLAQLGTLKIPVTVWVDGLGRLRKVTIAFDLRTVAAHLGLKGSTDPKITVTMELYDFGVAVNVVAPVGARNIEQVAYDRAAQSDLRNALTAEKTNYTDDQTYTSDAGLLKQIEPTLDWGGKLTVVVGAADGQPDQVICLSERSASGVTFALADVAAGPGAGTFYGKAGCPKAATEENVSTLGSSW